MQKRRLGKERFESVGSRTRLHGDELFLRSAHGQAGDDRTLRSAVDRGVTFFDTAEGYGPFTNEDWWVKPLRPSAGKW